ncbi:MAG: hypothetical protein LBR62_00085, partial [Puniceicoccales bacterium]|nr:hypothetical protein [Puniceicoccales bacterium]
ILSLINEDRPQLLRPGPVSVEELEAVLKCSIAAPPLEDEEKHPKPCPGLFRKHYSPRTPLILYPSLQNSPPPETNIARVFFQKPIHTTGEAVFWLTSKGDLNQAASRLFRLLQELDRKGYDEIWMETAPDTGIGRAINDRLRHAAAQNTDAS